jgi:multidrug efflux pump subunit AcrA (membrane-fusion protein)
MKTTYTGITYSPIIEIRFAYSGKIVYVKKKVGNTIKQWEAIASLDRKILQAELDRQLADYEKVRAQFELFNIKYGQDGDDTTKFMRQEKQSALNASVKEVEIAKYKLDQADLISPIAGTILSMDGLLVGLHSTPASSAVQILKTDTLIFSFEIEQKDLEQFRTIQTITVTFPNHQKEYQAQTDIPLKGNNSTFIITSTLQHSDPGSESPNPLIPGMKGKAQIT